MCLSIAINRPDDVLATGHHKGYEWMVIHNGIGYRCGYIRLPKGHPWHGKDFAGSWDEDDCRPCVHGGITFSAPDRPCDKGGADDAFWQGFDCAHSGDAPDPELPCDRELYFVPFSDLLPPHWGIVRSQEYVEAECRKLADQADEVARAAGFAVRPEDHHHHDQVCEVTQ